MGKRSTKENKNIYQMSRETAGLSREAAEALLSFVSADRIERIESGRSMPHPDEVLAMEQGYKNPELSNYYCTNECPIGKKYVPEVQVKELSQIAIETLNSLNRINREKDRLLEIIEDGRVTDDEIADFVSIKKTLDKISLSVDTLQLWVDQAIADGNLDKTVFEEE